MAVGNGRINVNNLRPSRQSIAQKQTKTTKMRTKTTSQKPCREYISEFTGLGVLPFEFVFFPFVPFC